MRLLAIIVAGIGIWSLLAFPVAIRIGRFLAQSDRAPEPKKRRVA